MSEGIVEQLAGLGPESAALAYKYLCKGFGQHALEAEDIDLLARGVAKANVEEFIPFGEHGPEAGYIDVVFTGQAGWEVFHYEFRCEVSGYGGFVPGHPKAP